LVTTIFHLEQPLAQGHGKRRRGTQACDPHAIDGMVTDERGEHFGNIYDEL
jgi:hypothetical protein